MGAVGMSRAEAVALLTGGNGTGSRRTSGMPSGWRSCFGWTSCPWCGCRRRPGRPPAISSGAGTMSAGTWPMPATGLQAVAAPGRVWRGGTGWTCVHHEWLSGQRFTDADTQFAFDERMEELLALEAMRDRFDQRVKLRPTAPSGRRWCIGACWRGIDTLSAFGLAVEVVTDTG